MHKTLWIALVLLLAAGCGGDEGDTPAAGPAADDAPPANPTRKPADWPSPEARRMAPDKHPTPYTAAQLRRGCKDGRTLVYRIQNRGQETLQEWTFEGGDEKGVTWVLTPLRPDKKPGGAPQKKRMEWTFLQSHGSHPAATTRVSEETIETPAGRFACMVYAVAGTSDLVRQGKDERETVERTQLVKYWFAWALPGPPVRMETRIDGEVVTSMVLVENRYEQP